MLTVSVLGLLALFLPSTAPPDISGYWSGESRAQITLNEQSDGSYEGTFSGAFGNASGKMQLKWSRLESRFNGDWKAVSGRFGSISIRLDKGVIRGAWTTNGNPNDDSGTPKLADLRWVPDDSLLGNVALSSRGASVEGVDSHPQALLDGRTTGYHGTSGWARSLNPATWIVTLPRHYPLQQIRLLLYDRDSRKFHYTIETSADGENYESVADRSREWARSWQVHSFAERSVRFIRVTCLRSSYDDRPREDGFFAVELEAYCRPPDPQLPFSGGPLSGSSAEPGGQSTLLTRLRQYGAKITRKDGLVTEILLGNAPVTDADIAGIESIPSLESLTLYGCMNVTDAGFGHLRNLPQLKTLNIGPSRITDAGLANLKGLKELSFLNLNGTSVTDAGLMHLRDNSRINVLYLNETKVTDNGLLYLEQMKDMHSLDLGKTGVTDVGLTYIGHMSNLNQLHLSGAKVTDHGMEHVSKLSNLTSLRLSDTSIGDAGLVHLSRLPKLRDLQLRNTSVTLHGIETFRRANPNVTIIHDKPSPASLSDCGAEVLLRDGTPFRVNLTENFDVHGLVFFDGSATIEEIDAARCRRLVDADLAHFSEITNLKKLYLPPNIGDEGLHYIRGLMKLEVLYLNDGRFTDRGMAHLKRLTNLVELSLWRCSQISGAGLKNIEGMKRLKRLDLRRCDGLTDSALVHVKDLTSLESLDFSVAPGITTDGLRHIQTLQNLRNLGTTRTGIRSLEPIRELTRLESLNIPAQIDDAQIAHLEGLTQLRRLSLECCPITDDAIAHLRNMKNLEWLDIHKTEVTDACLGHLQGLKNLKYLQLQGTGISEEGVKQTKTSLPDCEVIPPWHVGG